MHAHAPSCRVFCSQPSATWLLQFSYTPWHMPMPHWPLMQTSSAWNRSRQAFPHEPQALMSVARSWHLPFGLPQHDSPTGHGCVSSQPSMHCSLTQIVPEGQSVDSTHPTQLFDCVSQNRSTPPPSQSSSSVQPGMQAQSCGSQYLPGSHGSSSRHPTHSPVPRLHLVLIGSTLQSSSLSQPSLTPPPCAPSPPAPASPPAPPVLLVVAGA